MMRSGTGRRTAFTPPPPPPEAKPAYTLPSDLLLEIVARTSDAATVIRCAATCKELRRGILSPGFVRRICHGPDALMPPSFLGYLRVHNDDERRASFSLVHPATPAAVAFSRSRLVPFLQTYRAGARARLLAKYTPVAASRNGLVALRRRCGDICVYDPMAGGHRPAAHVPLPPGIEKPSRRARRGFSWTYVLLTAADAGVGCSSFLLLAAGFSAAAPDGITVQTVSSDDAAGGGAWGPVTAVRASRQLSFVQPHCWGGAVVLGGSVHWLMFTGEEFHILAYDVRAAAAAASIDVPAACLPDRRDGRRRKESDLHLTSSRDGRLALLVADRLTISVWVLSAGGTSWARRSVIDTEPTLRYVSPALPPESDWSSTVIFASSGARSGAVLVRPFSSQEFLNCKGEQGLLLLDVETKKVRRVKKKMQEDFPYEVDMEARLLGMKIY